MTQSDRRISYWLGIMLYTSHVCGCVIVFVGHVQCGWDPLAPKCAYSWLKNDNLLGADTTRKYARSIHWAVYTLVTVGFGDIAPVTDLGTAVTSVIELVGMYISCSIIAAWASRFAAMNGARSEHDKIVDDVVAYMHSRKLPPALQRTVRAYFQYTWSTQEGLSEQEVLKSLPGHLRTEALSFLQGAILKQ